MLTDQERIFILALAALTPIATMMVAVGGWVALGIGSSVILGVLGALVYWGWSIGRGGD